MTRSRQRISTDGGQDIAQDNPFAAIQASGLPSGPAVQPRPEQPAAPKRRETLLVRRLTAGKGGKVVTEVSGFTAGTDLSGLLKRVQGRLGTGGTIDADRIELQGECRERVKPLLESEGFRVKGI